MAIFLPSNFVCALGLIHLWGLEHGFQSIMVFGRSLPHHTPPPPHTHIHTLTHTFTHTRIYTHTHTAAQAGVFWLIPLSVWSLSCCCGDDYSPSCRHRCEPWTQQDIGATPKHSKLPYTITNPIDLAVCIHRAILYPVLLLWILLLAWSLLSAFTTSETSMIIIGAWVYETIELSVVYSEHQTVSSQIIANRCLHCYSCSFRILYSQQWSHFWQNSIAVVK